jgi:hypothetical protein
MHCCVPGVLPRLASVTVTSHQQPELVACTAVCPQRVTAPRLCNSHQTPHVPQAGMLPGLSVHAGCGLHTTGAATGPLAAAGGGASTKLLFVLFDAWVV